MADPDRPFLLTSRTAGGERVMIGGGTDVPWRDIDGYSPCRKGAAMLHSTSGTVRIGVAFDVPPPWGPELTRARARTGDPQAATVPAHVTLLGPTEISPDELPAVESHLAAVATRHQAFELLLRGTGTFRPVTDVVFVAIAAGISECEQLAAEIGSLSPLDRPRSFPYHPHVTVAQDVAQEALDQIFADLASFEARFRVDGFTLFTHTGDLRTARWHPQRDFELHG